MPACLPGDSWARGFSGFLKWKAKEFQEGGDTWALLKRHDDGCRSHQDAKARFDHYPPKVASLIYFGLLADAFMEPERNELRNAPRSPVLQTLYRLQGEHWAVVPIKALLERMANAERFPLYLPTSMTPRIELACLSHFDREPAGHLRGLQINGVEVLAAEQSDVTLRLETMLGREAPTLELLKQLAADLYGLPLDQIEATGDVAGPYIIEPYLGFRSPSIVWLPISARAGLAGMNT